MSDNMTIAEEELVDWQAEWDAAAPNDLAAADPERELAHYVRVQTAIEAEIERVQQNARTILTQLAKRQEWFERTYGPAAREACRGLLHGKAKSVKTLYGVAGFRLRGELLVVEDADSILAAVRAGTLPAGIAKATLSVSKEALNALYAETGEVPDGCTVRPAEDVFYVR